MSLMSDEPSHVCLMFPMFVVLVLSIHIVMCMYLMSMHPKYVYPIHSLSIYVWYNNIFCILSVSDNVCVSYPSTTPPGEGAHRRVAVAVAARQLRRRRVLWWGGFFPKAVVFSPPSLMMMCGVECV